MFVRVGVSVNQELRSDSGTVGLCMSSQQMGQLGALLGDVLDDNVKSIMKAITECIADSIQVELTAVHGLLTFDRVGVSMLKQLQDDFAAFQAGIGPLDNWKNRLDKAVVLLVTLVDRSEMDQARMGKGRGSK